MVAPTRVFSPSVRTGCGSKTRRSSGGPSGTSSYTRIRCHTASGGASKPTVVATASVVRLRGNSQPTSPNHSRGCGLVRAVIPRGLTGGNGARHTNYSFPREFVARLPGREAHLGLCEFPIERGRRSEDTTSLVVAAHETRLPRRLRGRKEDSSPRLNRAAKPVRPPSTRLGAGVMTA